MSLKVTRKRKSVDVCGAIGDLYYRARVPGSSSASWDMLLEFTECSMVGKGSYGEVVQARWLGERVAIKRVEILEDNLSSDWENGLRVLRELHFLKNLCHPNLSSLVTVYPNNPSASTTWLPARLDRVYVVTKYYSDGPLSSYVPRSVKEVIAIQHKLMSALAYLHANGVLHRDVKRENIFVQRTAGLVPKVVLGDFGLSRSRRPGMTSEVVTKPYRCPSLLLQETEYGGEIDVFAAGIVFLEMLLGKPNVTLLPNKKMAIRSFLKHQLALSHATTVSSRMTELASAMHIDLVELVECTKNPSDFDDRMVLEWRRQAMAQIGEDGPAKEFALKLVRFNPDDRLTANEALADPIFHGLTCANPAQTDEPSIRETYDDSIRSLASNDEKGFALKRAIWSIIAQQSFGQKLDSEMTKIFPGETVWEPRKRTRSQCAQLTQI